MTDQQKEESDITVGELIRRKRQKRVVSSLTITILAVNVIALILLTMSVLSINRYQDILIQREADVLEIQSQLYLEALRENALEIDMTNPSTPIVTIDKIKSQSMMVGLGESTPSQSRLYDANGEMIANSQWWDYGGSIDGAQSTHSPDDDILMSLLDGMKKTKITRPFNEAPNIRVGMPFKHGSDTVGTLVLDYNVTFIRDMVRVMRMEIAVVFVSGLAIMILLSIYLTGVLGRPLKKLATAADAMRHSYGRRGEIPDFTDRNDEIGDLSDALRELTQALRTRLKTIESFAADVSHELKNPLTSLRSAIETLDKIEDPEKIAKLREIIVHDLIRMDRLISDISAASRLDAELSEDEAEDINLPDFLEACVIRKQMMLKNMSENGHKNLPTVELDNKTFTPTVINGNADRLLQVMDNIISNALSFAPENSKINVGLEHRKGVAIITVDDQGPGIPESKLDTIFDRFYTDRPFDDKFGNNSGLGLSICRQIINVHQGKIKAQNIKNDDNAVIGARFTLYLPTKLM